jgi:TonB family protein
MYIDFEDYRPETPRVEGALSGSTAVLITITFHVLFVLAVIFLPSLPFMQALVAKPTEVQVAPAQQQAEQNPRFVFMQPRVDRPKPQPKQNVDMSDQDRVKSSAERPPDPQNELPFARGNSPEKTEADVAPEKRGTAPDSATAGRPNQPDRSSESEVAANDPQRSMLRLPDAPSSTPPLKMGKPATAGGPLGEALRNLQRYTKNQSFGNAQGSGDAQGLIQFDSKGADFGPWLRRFIAQVKSNWFIPSAAMLLKGHVVITFNVHRNGAITDIEVRDPSGIDAFDRAAVNALLSSNPTQVLPPDYPTESAFFTVTFLYNEEPPSGYYR